MGVATCSWCHCDVAEVDGPTMCASCGLTIFPDGTVPSDGTVASEETLPSDAPPAAPLELSSWRGLARHRAAADPVVEPAAEPGRAPEPKPRTIVGQSIAVPSLWRSFQFTGRDGVHCAAGLALYALVALTFLAIVFRPFSAIAWAISVFVVLQGFSALVYAAARYVNRQRLVDDVEQAVLWSAAPLLAGVALAAAVLTLHSLIGGIVATALLAANASVLHRRLAAPLAAGPRRALEFVATGLLAAAGLAPLAGAVAPLAACAVAILLLRGQLLVTRRRDEDAAPQHYIMLKVSALLLLGAFAATFALSRGAMLRDHVTAVTALSVWGLFLTSFVLVFRSHCASDPQALSDDLRKWLDVAIATGLSAGFALTLGDPVGMVVTGAIACTLMVRESLRLDRALLLLPAVAISCAAYAWIPDPRTLGTTSLRGVVVPALERLTGATPFSVGALCFAPWAIALVAIHTLLFRRGRTRHALFVGACALPASLAVCAGMLVGSGHHWIMGSSLAVTSAVLLVCGVAARQLLAVIPGSIGLLLGVGTAAAAAGFSHAAIELMLALTVLAVLLELGATMSHATEFARSFSRRWIDAATLFVMTAIPVAVSAGSFRLPSEPATIGNELVLGLLAFFVVHAWRRPEAAIAAAALFGRAGLGFIALRFPDATAVRGVEIVAAASAIPVVLWFLTPLVPLARRVVPAAPPGVVATLLTVWTIQGFGAWKYARALTGIVNDVPALITIAVCVVTPWILAVVAGLRAGAPRRSEDAPIASIP